MPFYGDGFSGVCGVFVPGGPTFLGEVLPTPSRKLLGSFLEGLESLWPEPIQGFGIWDVGLVLQKS